LLPPEQTGRHPAQIQGGAFSDLADPASISNTGFNTCVGYQCMSAVTRANSDTGIGYEALKSITTGTQNTAAGLQALLTWPQETKIRLTEIMLALQKPLEVTTYSVATMRVTTRQVMPTS
jgi:hypothetical protein